MSIALNRNGLRLECWLVDSISTSRPGMLFVSLADSLLVKPTGYRWQAATKPRPMRRPMFGGG